MENSIETLIKRAEGYAEKAGCTESVASLHIFNDGKRLGELKAGSKMWPHTIKAAIEKIDTLEAGLSAQ